MHAYGLSKILGEDLCAGFTARTSIPTVSLRPMWVWHPEQYEKIEAQWRAEAAAEWEPFWEFGAFVDVRDVASAVELALTVPLTGHHRVTLCAADIAATEPSLVMAAVGTLASLWAIAMPSLENSTSNFWEAVSQSPCMAACSRRSLVISVASSATALPEKRSSAPGIWSGGVPATMSVESATFSVPSIRGEPLGMEYPMAPDAAPLNLKSAGITNPRLRTISGTGARGKRFRLTVTPQRGRRRYSATR